ncbi:MAG: hypothetical protein C5S47_02145 [Candidatus Methanogasteraceae archaeon]|nr:MAG: hypothetical protein C5S47_02145 [ANME-2 cluster archaeon]
MQTDQTQETVHTCAPILTMFTTRLIATDGAGLNMTAEVTVRYELLRGDLNRDGRLAAADVSGDNRVTSLDALMILQAAGGVMDL